MIKIHRKEAHMGLYMVSTKRGNDPYQFAAYVEAGSPKEAIRRYCGGDERYRANIDDGYGYRATLSGLPERFWDMTDYIHLD